MENVCIAFDKLDGVTPNEMRKGNIVPVYEDVNVRMISDINMYGKFKRYERLVDNGYTITPP